MTRAGYVGYRLRWVLLVLGLTCMGLWIWLLGLAPVFADFAGLMGTPVSWGFFFGFVFGPQDDRVDIAIAGLFLAGLMLIAQWMFLRPSRRWTVRMTSHARPMRTAVIAAAFMAMMLTTGLVITLFELADWWKAILDYDWPALWLVWGVMALLWLGWAVVFFIYWRQGDRYTWLGRIIRGLFAGSIAEMLIATGVFAWNPHHEDCYCARGSYTGLILGGTVLVWAFGPGIVLLFMRERYRRERLIPVCDRCGYDLRGLQEAGRDSCPECGTPFATTGRRVS